jgi:phosphate transport system substrate-binding protein
MPSIHALITLAFSLFVSGTIVSNGSSGLAENLPLIKLDGSSTVFPLSDALADDFHLATKGSTRVTVGISGSGGGFKKFCRGETDVNGASRPILEEEMEACRKNGVRYFELPVAYDALSIVVSTSNTWIESLTVGELKMMWEPAAQGKITLWNQIRRDWPAALIKLYGAGSASGSFDYFTQTIVGKAKASRTDYAGSEDDNFLVDEIAGSRFALGYIPFAYLETNRRRLKAVAIDAGQGPVLPTRDAVVSGQYRPLTRPMFIYVNHRAAQRPVVKQFVEYYLSHAARFADEVKYVPLPSDTYQVALDLFRQGKVGTVFEGTAVGGKKLEELLPKERKE